VAQVVFWHRCTAHKVAENYSDVIRQAVIYDFCAPKSAEAGWDTVSEGAASIWAMWEDVGTHANL
jgi:hypothetical protein